MTRAALESFRRTVTVNWPAATERGAKAHLIKTARAGHQRIMADARSRGSEPTWEAYANTPGNSNLSSVVLPGPIVFRYRYFREIIAEALLALQKASPVQSGDYVRSHTVYINGVPVTKIPERLTLGDEIMIANPIVYSRRLEIGKTKSGRDFVMQVPNRIYERVAKQVLIPRFRNVAKISFSYVTPPASSQYTTKAGLASHYGTGKRGKRGGGSLRKRRQKAGTIVRVPAIIIGSL